MPLAQTLDAAQRANQMSLRCLLRDRNQRVRHAGQRGHNHDRALLGAGRNNATGARNGFGVADGGPAELEDDHVRPSSPRWTISSALSTDAPAAPRTTLW